MESSTDPALRPLLFSWRVSENRWWKLIVCTLVAGGLVTMVSLVFRVATLPRPSFQLNPQRITLLASGSSSARQILEAAKDRDFLVLRSPSSAAPELKTPVFSPSFKGFELRVREDLETGQEPATTPKLFLAANAPLPAMTRAMPAVPTALPEQQLRAKVESGLSNRPIVRAHVVDDSAAAGLSLRVAVDALGRVTTALPLNLSAENSAAFTKIRAQLDHLRFAPKPDSTVEWGVISLQWSPRES